MAHNPLMCPTWRVCLAVHTDWLRLLFPVLPFSGCRAFTCFHLPCVFMWVCSPSLGMNAYIYTPKTYLVVLLLKVVLSRYYIFAIAYCWSATDSTTNTVEFVWPNIVWVIILDFSDNCKYHLIKKNISPIHCNISTDNR